jgi:hypothetical protein
MSTDPFEMDGFAGGGLNEILDGAVSGGHTQREPAAATSGDEAGPR